MKSTPVAIPYAIKFPVLTVPLAMVIGVVLLTLSSKFTIPSYPVPFTLQPFVVLLIGLAYGMRLGVSTVLSYLVLGAAGAPVFAGTPHLGIGLPYMLGPTGGYLLGFLLATAATGYLAERGFDKRTPTTLLAVFAGLVLIYLPGVLWLGTLLGWSKPILTIGLLNFLPADVVKAVLAALLFPRLRNLVTRL